MQVKDSCFYLQLQDKLKDLLTFILTQTNVKSFGEPFPLMKRTNSYFLTLTLHNGRMADIFHY